MHAMLLVIGLIGLALIAFTITSMLIDMPEKGTLYHTLCEAGAYVGCIMTGAPLAVYAALEMCEEKDGK